LAASRVEQSNRSQENGKINSTSLLRPGTPGLGHHQRANSPNRIWSQTASRHTQHSPTRRSENRTLDERDEWVKGA
jgi:hypothetical protein